MKIQAISLIAFVTFFLWNPLSIKGDDSLERPNVLFIAIDDLRPAVGC